jgi:hypothetical protein
VPAISHSMECPVKKIVKTVSSQKSLVSSDIVQPSSTEVAAVVTPTPPAVAQTTVAAAPPPIVVTTMADAAVQECNTLLNQVLAKVGSQDPLNADQIRRSTKMRKGGAEVIPKILALCQEHGITQVGPLTVQEMSDEQKRGDALQQVGLRSALVQKKLKDSAMGAHGRSWQIATTMYIVLQRMAVNDPELALGLQPVEEFFQTKATKGRVRVNKKASLAKKAAKEAVASKATGEGATAEAPVVASPPTASSSVNGAEAPASPPASPNAGGH